MKCVIGVEVTPSCACKSLINLGECRVLFLVAPSEKMTS
jgi:hypothetical protein